MNSHYTELEVLKDWKLLRGSHEFPGPDGGTCITEVAILVEGLAYRQVLSVSDVPECFSPPVATILICLNDRMDDELRQRLIRFAPRLPGSADPRFERERALAITKMVADRIIAPLDSEMALRAVDEIKCKVVGDDTITAMILLWSAVLIAHGRLEAWPDQVYNIWIEALDAALAIGRQAAPIPFDLIVTRLSTARRRATTALICGND